MKYLISFHNSQGYSNVYPIAESLSNKGFYVTLLDLTGLYGQSIKEIENSQNLNIIKENSIFSNVRNLNKLQKLCFFIINYLKLNKLSKDFDAYIFSPGGFMEGLIAKKFKKDNKRNYFVEAGVKIYLFLSSQNELKPQSKFLDHVDAYFTTGDLPKRKLNKFINSESKIYNYGVPRYSTLTSQFNSKINFEPKKINSILFLTSAPGYHQVKWEDEWQKDLIKSLLNSSLIKDFIVNIKVHPRDEYKNYEEYQNLDNVNILFDTNIEKDILKNDCILSGPSTSIHESSFMKRLYLTIWPFDKINNEYMLEESNTLSLEELINKIYFLDKNLKNQVDLYNLQLDLAKNYINIDSVSSTKNIIKHIINENKERKN